MENSRATLTHKPLLIYLRPEQLEVLRALTRRRKVAISELVLAEGYAMERGPRQG